MCYLKGKMKEQKLWDSSFWIKILGLHLDWLVGTTWVLAPSKPSMLDNRKLKYNLDWTAEICLTEMKSEPSIVEHELSRWKQHPCSTGSPILEIKNSKVFKLTKSNKYKSWEIWREEWKEGLASTKVLYGHVVLWVTLVLYYGHSISSPLGCQ